MTLKEALLGSGKAGAPPTLLCPSSLPMDADEWKQATFRERLTSFVGVSTKGNGDLPTITVTSVYAIFGVIWWYIWSKFFMDHDQDFLGDFNMRRFIMYNALHGLVGLGATCGLLGFRFKIPAFGVALSFLTPGAICSPLLPEVVRLLPGCKVPAKRSVWHITAYIGLVVAFYLSLTDPEGVTWESPDEGFIYCKDCWEHWKCYDLQGQHIKRSFLRRIANLV